MPRNVELIQKQFGSKEPLPSIELAYNALKLGGILAKEYALKKDLSEEVDIVLGNIQEVIAELEEHETDDVRHLTPAQIEKINEAINAVQALAIANGAINDKKDGIVAEAVQKATDQSEEYTDAEVRALRTNLENKIGELDVPTVVDPETGEENDQPLADAFEENPQKLINPEYFYRFKNMINNSSFEVFDGTTMIPYGWDNGVVSEDAAMFHTHSLKLTGGQIAKQTSPHQADINWLKGAYDTEDVVLCFYHKFDACTVKVYDVANEEYLTLTELDTDLTELVEGQTIEYPYAPNWNQYRCMVKFTPAANTRKVRVEFGCNGGNKGECYIDAPSMEPYVAGEYPSIYKDGIYSISAYQLLNPPPADVDRFTALEHFYIDGAETITDEKGNVTHQVLKRADGTIGIVRDASNPDVNGYYQTYNETFYRKDGMTVNYTDTYIYTYSASGAILSKTKTTTEVP